MKKIPKSEAKETIELFFKDILNKTPKQVKKIKKLAMRYNIALKEKRKLFCKKCYAPYKNPKIRIKKGHKTIVCEECKYVSRWKLK
ncbi:MAG: hypothetical protein ACE5ES_05215 [Candidatus Nanoarchaeia archaeon]